MAEDKLSQRQRLVLQTLRSCSADAGEPVTAANLQESLQFEGQDPERKIRSILKRLKELGLVDISTVATPRGQENQYAPVGSPAKLDPPSTEPT